MLSPADLVVEIALDCYSVAPVDCPVCPEAALRSPPIVKLHVGMELRAAINTLSIDPIIESGIVAATHPKVCEALVDVPAAGGERACPLFPQSFL